MNFELSSDHQMLADTLRRYFLDNLPIEKRNQAAYTAPYHAPDTWAALAELGVLGAFVSEEKGGFGGSAQDAAVVFEEAGRALCPEPLLGALMGLRLLSDAGQDALVEKAIGGEAQIALAVVEPEVTRDLTTISAKATQDGANWKLTGSKSAIYGGPSSTHLLIAAQTGDGVGLFLSEAPAMTGAAMIDGGGIAELEMDGLQAQCLSTDAAAALDDAIDLGRIALCAEAVGAMSWLIDATVEYLGQRTQFGRPLASFQALQHRLVDLVGELEQARSITISAVASFGTPEQSRHTSMAKNLIGRAATKVAEEAVQMHGGIGMTWEYPGSHYAKRLVMIDHQLGDRFDHAAALSR